MKFADSQDKGRVFLTATMWSIFGGLMVSIILNLWNSLNSNPSNWGFGSDKFLMVFWRTLILGPFFGSLLLGIPWLLACAINSLSLVIAYQKNRSALFLCSISIIASISGTFIFYKIFLWPLIIENRNCRTMCLGFENIDLGIPFWNWILIGLWFTNLIQVYGVIKYRDNMKNV